MSDDRRFFSAETKRDPRVPLGGILEQTFVTSHDLAARTGARMAWEYTTRLGRTIILGNEHGQWLEGDGDTTDVDLFCLNQNRDNWGWWARSDFVSEDPLPVYTGVK